MASQQKILKFKKIHMVPRKAFQNWKKVEYDAVFFSHRLNIVNTKLKKHDFLAAKLTRKVDAQ